MHTIRRHPAVRTDFEEAFSWYQDQRYGLGYEFASAFRVALGSIKQNPSKHACRLDDIRRVNLRRFPYGIFYAIEGDTIVILALFHERRDWKRLLQTRKQSRS